MADDLLGFLQREYREGWLRVDPTTELSTDFLEHLERYIDAECTGRARALEARIADQERVIHQYENNLARLRTAVRRAGLDPQQLLADLTPGGEEGAP